MRPTILSAVEARIRDRPPPPMERRAAHKWLGKEKADRCRGADDLGLYVSKVAEEKMRNHAISLLPLKREAMGLMLGSVYSYGGKLYSLVRDVATTDLDTSSVHVRFQRDAFEKLFDSLSEAGFNYVIVGWYHSHPGHGCFMSSTDVDTQRTLFNMPFHSALVIDPLNQEIGAFCLENGEVSMRDFAVYWDEYENPYHGSSVRRRVVRSNPDGVAPPQ